MLPYSQFIEKHLIPIKKGNDLILSFVWKKTESLPLIIPLSRSSSSSKQGFNLIPINHKHNHEPAVFVE